MGPGEGTEHDETPLLTALFATHMKTFSRRHREGQHMPLIEIDAMTAWENIFKDTGLCRWPGEGARLYPIAAPEFKPGFLLESGSKVFTIGSCFARNIEHYLDLHKFDVAAFRHFGRTHLLNKYNPASMLQEIRWATDKSSRLTIDQRLVQVGDDEWFDVHLHHNQPFSRKHCEIWARVSEDLGAEIFDCPYFIVTMGLAEIWFDRETDCVLNEPVHFMKYFKENARMRKYFQDRFVFRVMSFEEAYSATHEMFSLIKKASPNCRAILTVSPVPLQGTFTGKEIITANMYSKSMLRTVAEQICVEFDFIDYFPSYESVMLSPRPTTWESDGVHVKDEVVKFNVERMVDRYLKPPSVGVG
jgi:hypothetical protein